MPLSWRFHGTFNQTEPQTVSCHFHGTFPKNYFKIVIIGYFMFVSVYLSSVFLFFFWYFHWCFFRLIKVFVFFLWSKYRVKKQPKQQLSDLAAIQNQASAEPNCLHSIVCVCVHARTRIWHVGIVQGISPVSKFKPRHDGRCNNRHCSPKLQEQAQRCPAGTFYLTTATSWTTGSWAFVLLAGPSRA